MVHKVLTVGEVKKFLEDKHDNDPCGMIHYRFDDDFTEQIESPVTEITWKYGKGVFFKGVDATVIEDKIGEEIREYKDKVNSLLEEYYTVSANCESIIAVEIINKLKKDLEKL